VIIRGFLLISLLVTLACVAFLGFRGKKSADPPFEMFPDMVRQPKIRAQSVSNFFADHRGSRLPIEGTVPIGYEPPQAKTIATPAPAVPAAQSHERLAFSAGTQDQVDAMAGESLSHGWTELFPDKYPHAGGPGHYAAYLVNADGYEVELIAAA